MVKKNEIFEYIGKHQESWTIELTSTGIKGKYLIENVEVSSFLKIILILFPKTTMCRAIV